MTVHQLDLVWRLAVALGLSGAIGLERELRQKSAGLRTYALVGTGAALFTIVSAYGFAGVLQKQLVVLDPSRIAAQIVSGLGFIGGGLIFVRRDSVRGLTTAAGIWVTAAIGMAAGAGLALLALIATGMYMVVSIVFPLINDRVPSRTSRVGVRLSYLDEMGILRRAIEICTGHGFEVADLKVERSDREERGHRVVDVSLELRGRSSLTELAGELDELDGVLKVEAAPGEGDV